MRDYLVFAIVFGSLPFILRRPTVGILVWAWLGYMNPHRLCWGPAYGFPFAEIVAVVTLMSVAITKEKLWFPKSGLTLIWITFIVWTGITTAAAIFPDDALARYEEIIKIQLVTFLIMMIMGSRERLNKLLWVTVLSLGFFSVKGGAFTIATGGDFRVWGPPDSFIADNNSMALASLMIIPLFFYLRQYATKGWVRWGLVLAMLLSFAAALGSQSRGAMLASLCMAFFLWLKSKNKAVIGILVLICIPIGFAMMPKEWHKRMDTIETYKKDASAMGRINAWHYAFNVASARLTGAGLESWSHKTFAKWAPNPDDVHVAHSIYFSVLADSGWPGLFMFLLIIVLAWRRGNSAIRKSKGHPEVAWAGDMARMVQVSLVAYFTGGAFLSLSYFDLPWQLYAVLVLLDRIAGEAVGESKHAGLEVGKLAGAAPGGGRTTIGASYVR